MGSAQAIQRGRALRVLPLLLALLLGASLVRAAGTIVQAPENPHLDLGVLSYFGCVNKMSEAPHAAGWPEFSNTTLLLASAGASWSTGKVHWSLMAATGSGEASLGTRSSRLLLDLGLLGMEERYIREQWEAGAGAIIGLGRAGLELRDAGAPSLSRLEAWAPAYGLVTHIRWPRAAKLSFGARGGYLWWAPAGSWSGNSSPAGRIDRLVLDAPFAQVDIQLSL